MLLIGLCALAAAANAGSVITVGDVRISALSATLLRIEPKVWNDAPGWQHFLLSLPLELKSPRCGLVVPLPLRLVPGTDRLRRSRNLQRRRPRQLLRARHNAGQLQLQGQLAHHRSLQHLPPCGHSPGRHVRRAADGTCPSPCSREIRSTLWSTMSSPPTRTRAHTHKHTHARAHPHTHEHPIPFSFPKGSHLHLQPKRR